MTFIYTVQYINIDDVLTTEHGAVSANSFTEAMTLIESYYGNDLEEINMLSRFDSPVLLIPEDLVPSIIDAQE